MDICSRIDDVVWGESEKVWDEIFSLLVKENVSTCLLVNVVMKWVLNKISEYESYYQKVLFILYESVHYTEEIRRFASHYHRIVWRYKTAYKSCMAMEYSI